MFMTRRQSQKTSSNRLTRMWTIVHHDIHMVEEKSVLLCIQSVFLNWNTNIRRVVWAWADDAIHIMLTSTDPFGHKNVETMIGL